MVKDDPIADERFLMDWRMADCSLCENGDRVGIQSHTKNLEVSDLGKRLGSVPIPLLITAEEKEPSPYFFNLPYPQKHVAPRIIL